MEFSCAVKVWGLVYAMAPFLFDDESLKTLSCFLTSVANHGHFEQLRFGKGELRDFSFIHAFDVPEKAHFSKPGSCSTISGTAGDLFSL